MESTAWVLSFDANLHAAVGELEMIHLVPSPELFTVPASPFYCRHVLIWEDNVLPVLDLVARLNGHCESQARALVGIFAYQDRAGVPPKHGGLLLSSTPRRIQVSDDQAAELPATPQGWRQIARSCFSDDEGTPIPVIDLAYVFSPAFLET